MSRFATCFATALAIASFATPALSDPARMPVDTHGIYRFIVNIHLPIGNTFTGGLFCHASVSQFGIGHANFSSSRDIPAKLVTAGQLYTCTVRIPYHWDGADNSNVIQPSVTIYSQQVTHTLGDQNVNAREDLNPAPLPGNGLTTTFNVDLSI